MAPRPRRARKALVLRLVLALVLGLAGLELGARVLVRAMDRTPLLRADPLTGWGLRPDLRGRRAFRTGDSTLSTDGAGRRRTAPEGVERRGPSLVVLGDSFAQGLGVCDDETFAWLASEALEREVVDLGVLGFECGQELAALGRLLEERAPGSVGDVVVLVFDNDLVDCRLALAPDVGRTRPLFREEAGALGPYSLSAVDRLMDASRVFWLASARLARWREPDEVAPAEGVGTVVACLQAMRARAAEHGARLHVLAHRRLGTPALVEDAVWEELLARSGALDLGPRLQAGGGARLLGPDGLHWNAAGHRLVARELVLLLGAAPLSGSPEGAPATR